MAVVAGDPYLWLVGAVGFALRGGLVLLIAPIVVLPTQVEVRLALGGNLGSTGLTPGFWALVAFGSLIVAAVALTALIALAYFERINFEHQADELGLPGGSPRSPLDRLFAVQALAFAALVLAALPLAAAVGQGTLDELLRPSSGESIYFRVLAHLGQPLLLFGAALVVVEMVSAIATRHLLSVSPGSLRGAIAQGLLAPFRAPVRVLGTAILGWLLSGAVLLPALWALATVWEAVRASFLATTSVADLGSDPAPLVVAVLLAAVFGGALLLAGLIGALRSALWTAARSA